jgi:hypothetical protein
MHLRHQVQVLPPGEAAPSAAGGGRRAPSQDMGAAVQGRGGAAASERAGRPRSSPAGSPRARRAQPPARGRDRPARELLEPGGQRQPRLRPCARAARFRQAAFVVAAGAWRGHRRATGLRAAAARPARPPGPALPAGPATRPTRLQGRVQRPASPAQTARRPVGPPAQLRPISESLDLGRAFLGRRRLWGTFGVWAPSR